MAFEFAMTPVPEQNNLQAFISRKLDMAGSLSKKQLNMAGKCMFNVPGSI